MTNKHLQTIYNLKEIIIPLSILTAIGLNIYFDNTAIAKGNFQWRWVIAGVNLIAVLVYYLCYLNYPTETEQNKETKTEQPVEVNQPESVTTDVKTETIKKPDVPEVKKSPFGLIRE